MHWPCTPTSTLPDRSRLRLFDPRRRSAPPAATSGPTSQLRRGCRGCTWRLVARAGRKSKAGPALGSATNLWQKDLPIPDQRTGRSSDQALPPLSLVSPTAEARTFFPSTMASTLARRPRKRPPRDRGRSQGIRPSVASPSRSTWCSSGWTSRSRGFGEAQHAKRYEPRQFPFLNLGRIYIRQGRWWQALREFEGAVRLAPRDARTARILHSLRAQLN